jgi:hypothetical protein
MPGISMDGITEGMSLLFTSKVNIIYLSSFTPLIRFLARFMGVPDEEELKYTMDKISDNFSNYSAWHNRRYTIAIYGHSF